MATAQLYVGQTILEDTPCSDNNTGQRDNQIQNTILTVVQDINTAKTKTGVHLLQRAS